MPLPLRSFFMELITRWATITFDESIDIQDLKNATISMLQPHSLGILFYVSSNEFSNKNSIRTLNINRKVFILVLSSTVANSSTQAPSNLKTTTSSMFCRWAANKQDVSFSSLSLQCKESVKALRRRNLLLYGLQALFS